MSRAEILNKKIWILGGGGDLGEGICKALDELGLTPTVVSDWEVPSTEADLVLSIPVPATSPHESLAQRMASDYLEPINWVDRIQSPVVFLLLRETISPVQREVMQVLSQHLQTQTLHGGVWIPPNLTQLRPLVQLLLGDPIWGVTSIERLIIQAGGPFPTALQDWGRRVTEAMKDLLGCIEGMTQSPMKWREEVVSYTGLSWVEWSRLLEFSHAEISGGLKERALVSRGPIIVHLTWQLGRALRSLDQYLIGLDGVEQARRDVRRLWVLTQQLRT